MSVFRIGLGLAIAALFFSDAEARAAADYTKAEEAARKAVENPGVPSVAVAVAADGRLVYEGGFGFADKARRIGATARTPYALASATKPIVATAVLSLVERGRLSLDAPVGPQLRWAPSEAKAQAGYTIRQLLGHTVGLGTYARIDWADSPSRAPSLEETFAKYGRPVQRPGFVCEYSNLGYGVLGRLVEQASGTPLADAIARSVFRPLRMSDSSFIEGDATPARGAVKYDAAGQPLVATRNDTPGAGNAWASARDLAQFGAFHLSTRSAGPVSPDSRRLMRTTFDPQATYHYYDGARYGLGWYWRRTEAGEAVVWHEGGMPGASALLVLLPERNLAVAVLINATDANAVAQSVADAFVKAAAPGAPTIAFDAAAGFAPYAAQPGWSGRWTGEVEIDGSKVPMALDIGDGGAFVDFSGEGRTAAKPSRARFTPLLRGDVLLGTAVATVDAGDVDQTKQGYLLLRLVRGSDDLTGAIVAYAAPDRLEHLLPFRARLQRAPAAARP